MSRPTCISCRHFDMLETQLEELDTEGRCRRYPPQLDPNYDKYRSLNADQDGQYQDPRRDEYHMHPGVKW